MRRRTVHDASQTFSSNVQALITFFFPFCCTAPERKEYPLSAGMEENECPPSPRPQALITFLYVDFLDCTGTMYSMANYLSL